jgi:hypothetical protein
MARKPATAPDHVGVVQDSAEMETDRPMVLVLSDRAAGLLSERSPEGELARWFVENAARYGRKAGVRVSVGRETMDRLTGPGHNLRFILRASLRDQS